ncbi:hypothetical protein PRIPAC_80534 [Pristionchus pacificus]|uniref:Uncharacterized protein n=1 Tax=Pristionchus pacificus TaxID=54126 RepID=A0A2A6C489_PRIPA|nr:hypothetical protein PRIPAC_80534 [Pristionchus pacificus]|eukprot:PDM72995.1 hypothetical protein PRIPAC_39429 [Pristionchus pacificus]
MLSVSVLQFLNNVPVIPIIQILINACAFACCLFVFAVIRSTQLHSNCRLHFTVWSLFLFAFASDTVVNALSFFSSHGYLAESTVDSPARTYALQILVGSIHVSVSMEILIGLERALSASNPQRYYDQKLLEKTTILLVVVTTVSLSALIGYITFGASIVLSAIIFFFSELLAITVNTIAMKYCRKKEMESFGIDSLNARYQVRESADMASAMKPALVIAFLLKSSAAIFIVILCIGRSSDGRAVILHSFNWGIIESLCATVVEILLNIQLIRKHRRLRQNVVKILKKLWRPKHSANRSFVHIAPKCSEKDLYFDDLKRLWE